ncbi:hypothetical protein HPB52_018071 [Rhipicephalus sanguineus]|uniref:exodeoxyribonuclease III n=1 Tax=Rhipicephalus sanguineus TaxID=34632 RepID=A0A9D4T125_RHISA|nr:hypothetical protein HPB52_018071 [Rhipicephalus sanguineus]
MPLFKFASWNVRGFRDRAKQRDILALAREQNIDVLFTQETNFKSPLDVAMFRRDHRMDALFSLTMQGPAAWGLFSCPGSFRQQAHCTFGANGRMLLLDLNISGKVIRSHTNAFFKDLHQFLLEPLPHVILGDFNCVVDSLRDVRGPGQGGSTYRAKELVKVLRHLNSPTSGYTSTTTSSPRQELAEPQQADSDGLAECEVLALPSTLAGRTDHFPLTITLRGSPGPRNDNLGW